MKFFILFLISFSVFADWIPESKINECGSKMYSDSLDCSRSSQESCYEKTGEDIHGCGYFYLEPVYVEDETKPTYTEYGHFTCTNDPEENELPPCSLAPEFTCSQGGEVISESDGDNVTRFCKRQDGYELKLSHKILMINETLKTQKKNEAAAKLAMENAINAAKKAMDCGKQVQALLLVRNAPKQLTTAQIKQMVEIYAPIKQLLDTGSLVSAKEEIQSVTADGVLVTEADKTALIAEIDKCSGN